MIEPQEDVLTRLLADSDWQLPAAVKKSNVQAGNRQIDGAGQREDRPTLPILVTLTYQLGQPSASLELNDGVSQTRIRGWAKRLLNQYGRRKRTCLRWQILNQAEVQRTSALLVMSSCNFCPQGEIAVREALRTCSIFFNHFDQHRCTAHHGELNRTRTG